MASFFIHVIGTKKKSERKKERKIYFFSVTKFTQESVLSWGKIRKIPDNDIISH